MVDKKVKCPYYPSFLFYSLFFFYFVFFFLFFFSFIFSPLLSPPYHRAPAPYPFGLPSSPLSLSLDSLSLSISMPGGRRLLLPCDLPSLATSTATNAVRTPPERHLQRREGISSPRPPAAGDQHLPALRPPKLPADRLHPWRGAPCAAAGGQHLPPLRPPELSAVRLHARPGAPPAASTRGMELPARPPWRTTPSRPPATFPRAPSGACLGKRRAKRGEAALLQLRSGQTVLQSGNHGRKGIDSLTKLFLVSVWHSCVGNRYRSCSRSCAKGALAI
jgi:hypothetical protein